MQSEWWVLRFWSEHTTSISFHHTKTGPEWSSKTVIIRTRLYCVLTHTALWIHTTLSTSNPVPNNIKYLSIDENVTLGKPNYRRAVCFLQALHLISHTFSTKVYIAIHILPLKKTQELRSEILPIYGHYHSNTYFRVRTTHDEFQNSATVISQGESQVQSYLQCWTFSVHKQLLLICTTVTTWNEWNTYAVTLII